MYEKIFKINNTLNNINKKKKKYTIFQIKISYFFKFKEFKVI
jgi:hypothetical protein